MTTPFAPDRPLTDLKDDRYGRATFAIAVAGAIRRLPKGECFVIGINGAWGEGKSTVLEMIATSLNSDPPIAFKLFNPWRFTNEEAMIATFFQTVGKALGIDVESRGEKTAGTMANYLKYLSIAHEAAGTASTWLSQWSEISLEESRSRIRKELMTRARHAVIFIDDIDRLHANEAALLFRALKACADLPNIVYVLAFDREMVASTLRASIGDATHDAGERYLEKIIQIPLSLPPASAVDLLSACHEGVAGILERLDVKMTRSQVARWSALLEQCVSGRLKTPRAVTQYLNAVRFAVPLLAGRVDVVDLLLIEALRVFYPRAYSVIRDNPQAFVGRSSTRVERANVLGTAIDPLSVAFVNLNEKDTGALQYLLYDLFPQYRLARVGDTLSVGTSLSLWRNLRVACPPFFSRYFTYAVTEVELSDPELAAVMSAASQGNALQLRSLIDTILTDGKEDSFARRLSFVPDASSPAPAPAAPAASNDDDVIGLSPWTEKPGSPLQQLSLTGFITLTTVLAALASRFEQPYSLAQKWHPGLALCRQIGARFWDFDRDDLDLTLCEIVRAASETWFAASVFGAMTLHQSPIDVKALDCTRHFVQSITSSLPPHSRTIDPQRPWQLEAVVLMEQASQSNSWSTEFAKSILSDTELFIRYLRTMAAPRDPGDSADLADVVVTPETVEQVRVFFGEQFVRTQLMERMFPPDVQRPPDQWAAMPPDLRLLAQFWHWWSTPQPRQ